MDEPSNASPESCAGRVYRNAGNPPLLALLETSPRRVLDIGCGGGDNARLLRAANAAVEIHGITASAAEAATAIQFMTHCWIADLDQGLPEQTEAHSYDVILCSHVLEHLKNPADLVAQAARLLRPNGCLLVAVPNVMVWSQRLKFMLGKFEYTRAGIMDMTHLRFFTYDTARSLVERAPGLRITHHGVGGAVPLWILRRHLLSKRVAGAIDAAGCSLLPNLFGSQILIRAVRE